MVCAHPLDPAAGRVGQRHARQQFVQAPPGTPGQPMLPPVPPHAAPRAGASLLHRQPAGRTGRPAPHSEGISEASER
eukprot:scaffold289310_cov31-Tisochrysis_lutea.AAC.1